MKGNKTRLLIKLVNNADTCHFDCCQTPYTPEQIHLSTGSDITQMTVTWTTLELSPNPVAQWGTSEVML